ncbi:MAG TPA: ABC transporter substrate-binding protein [Acidimicrobiaceae bacterium]|nr:ABC transporter substrate-binding protein [Acidimicrobiaceae bacterium]
MKKVMSIFFSLLLLAACGDSGSTTLNTDAVTSEPAAESAVATEMPAQSQETTEPSDVKLDGPAIDYPESIVSLSPTATEMLFAIGAGEQVIAVDNYSYWPPQAPVVDDLSGWNPNVEAIAAFEPDLVILSDTGVQEELELLGIQVYIAAAAVELEDVYSQLEEIGEITGNSDGSSIVIGEMREQIKEIVEAIELPADSLTYFHELDDTLYSVTSSTFIGQIYAMTGLKNIADPADEDGTAWGYPQLSEEFILQADPDIIFFADATCCAQSLSTISARPGWSELSAVRNGNIFEMDSDISSRWGPRLVDFLKTVSDAVSTVNAR